MPAYPAAYLYIQMRANRIKLPPDRGRFPQCESDNECTMPFEWTEGALAEGLRCYCNQEFFEAHEHWESVWLKCDEPEKTFLQALIQITAAFHHLQRNNPTGTASLLRSALRRLESFPAEYSGVAVGELRMSIHMWLDALKAESQPPQIPFPHIR